MNKGACMVRVLARHFLSPLALVLFVAAAAAAQTSATGRLTGTVTDPQGAVLPGATILAKNTLTGSEFRAISDEAGDRDSMEEEEVSRVLVEEVPGQVGQTRYS